MSYNIFCTAKSITVIRRFLLGNKTGDSSKVKIDYDFNTEMQHLFFGTSLRLPCEYQRNLHIKAISLTIYKCQVDWFDAFVHVAIEQCGIA